MDISSKKMGKGRSMLMGDGVPLQVSLVTRPSRTAPSRIKASFVVPARDDDGLDGVAPMPIASAGRRFATEFRLEMN